MYRKVLRDPGGRNLVRILPNVCDERHAVVNGSILLVPAGTTAYVVFNGMLSPPYGPGRHVILTGASPFFVRLRNIMSHGDAGMNVTVFFISTQKSHFLRFGTGQLPFDEKGFHITMKAFACCDLTVSITNSLKFLQKLVGTYNEEFTEDDIEPFLNQLVMLPLREALSNTLSTLRVTEFNSNLTKISHVVLNRVRPMFSVFGMSLERFHVSQINVPDEEIKRLYELEEKYAVGRVKIDLEAEHLKKIWKNDLNKRTLTEVLTGIPSRGPGTTASGANGAVSGNNGMSDVMRIAMLGQILPEIKGMLEEVMPNHTNTFYESGSNSSGQNRQRNHAEQTVNRAAATDMSARRCPNCNALINRYIAECPVCGHRFHPG